MDRLFENFFEREPFMQATGGMFERIRLVHNSRMAF
jgi:hypothetical protein